MSESLPFLVAGVSLGLAAGITPGPLLALVLSESITKGRKQGMLVAIAPALTDIPIIGISLYLMRELEASSPLMGAVSLAGSVFIAYLSFKSFAAGQQVQGGLEEVRNALKKGILVNLLSPHPYIFWMTVGAPMVKKGMENGAMAGILFILAFYSLLVGSKVAIALLADHSRGFLRGKAYIYVERVLGILLLAFALIFFREGLLLTGII